jgi:hypothetical protein
MIAREFEDFQGHPPRVAKTYVISRKTLDNLEKVSSQYNTPRDALVEFSIERIIPLLTREKEKHKHRKALLEDIETYLEHGVELFKKAEESLGAGDPVVLALVNMLNGVQGCRDHMHDCVEKGNKIEDF